MKRHSKRKKSSKKQADFPPGYGPTFRSKVQQVEDEFDDVHSNGGRSHGGLYLKFADELIFLDYQEYNSDNYYSHGNGHNPDYSHSSSECCSCGLGPIGKVSCLF